MKQRRLTFAVLLTIVLTAALLAPSSRARSKKFDLDAAAVKARAQAYIGASAGMADDEAGAYTKLLLAREARALTPDDPEAQLWSAYNDYKLVSKSSIRKLAGLLMKYPDASLTYYLAIPAGIEECWGDTAAGIIKNWMKYHPDNSLGYVLDILVRMSDIRINNLFPQENSPESDSLVKISRLRELVADADTYRERFGFMPMVEGAALRALYMLDDTVGIVQRAEVLKDRYINEDEAADVLMEAYGAIGDMESAIEIGKVQFLKEPDPSSLNNILGPVINISMAEPMLDAVNEALSRPEIEINDKLGIARVAVRELYAYMSNLGGEEEDSVYHADSLCISAHLDSLYKAVGDVAVEYNDDPDVIMELTTLSEEWTRDYGYKIGIGYALANPDSVNMATLLTTTLMDELDSVAPVRPVLDNLLLREPDNGLMLYNNALWYYKMKDWDNAVKHLSTMKRENMTDAWYRHQNSENFDSVQVETLTDAMWKQVNNLLAQSYSNKGNYRAAVKTLKALLDDNPDDALLLNNLAYTMGEGGIDYDKALEYVDSSLAIQPDAFNSLDTRGWLLYLTGRYDEAYDVMLSAFSELELHGSEDGSDSPLTMAGIIDFVTFYGQVCGSYELENRPFDEVSPDQRQALAFLLFAFFGLTEEDAYNEPLYHLYKTALAAGHDYEAYSVALWLEGTGYKDGEVDKWLQSLPEPPARPINDADDAEMEYIEEFMDIDMPDLSL